MFVLRHFCLLGLLFPVGGVLVRAIVADESLRRGLVSHRGYLLLLLWVDVRVHEGLSHHLLVKLVLL